MANAWRRAAGRPSERPPNRPGESMATASASQSGEREQMEGRCLAAATSSLICIALAYPLSYRYRYRYRTRYCSGHRRPMKCLCIRDRRLSSAWTGIVHCAEQRASILGSDYDCLTCFIAGFLVQICRSCAGAQIPQLLCSSLSCRF